MLTICHSQLLRVALSGVKLRALKFGREQWILSEDFPWEKGSLLKYLLKFHIPLQPDDCCLAVQYYCPGTSGYTE